MSLRLNARLILGVVVWLAAIPASAQIAYDAQFGGAGGTGTITWTQTPVGVPKGLVVFVYCEDDTDCVDAVTADGITVPEVSCSPNLPDTGGAGSAYAFFLGSGIPNEALSMSVTMLTGGDKRAVSTTFTAGGDTEVIACVNIDQAAGANPSTTVSLGGRTAWVGITFSSGLAAITNTTELSGWTSQGEFDYGANVGGAYRYDTVSTADVTAGYTATSDTAVAVAVGIAQVAASAGTPRNCPLLGAC